MANLDSVRVLKRAGLTDAAVAELRRWVQQNPTAAIPADITALLKELNDRSLSLARAYSTAGLRDEAKAALQMWIREHPHESVPDDLKSLLDDSLEVVRSYQRAHLFDAAAAELQTWVQRHPGTPVPDDLRVMLPSDWAPWWQIRRLATPMLAGVLGLAAVLGLLALLAIRAFELWPPSLVIAALDSSDIHAGLGTQLSTVLRQRLVEPRTSAPSLFIASGPVVPDPIPADIASAIAPAGSAVVVVATLLKWIRPTRILTVSGTLHAIGVRGGGLTLTLSEGTKALSSVTLWQNEFEPDFKRIIVTRETLPTETYGAYDPLVAPAETWIRFHLRERLSKSSTTWAGTRSWLSHALFQAGLRANGLNRSETARRLYLASLAKDPSNLPARLNLALLLPPKLVSTRAEQLKFVVDQCQGRPNDTTYYSAAFSLAMLLAETDTKGAAKVAETLVNTIDNAAAPTTAGAGTKAGDQADTRLEAYLTIIAPSARVMAAALAEKPLPTCIDPSWPTAEFQYNLACYYGMRKDDDASWAKAMTHLELANALDGPRVAKQAAADAGSCLKNVANADSTKERFKAITNLVVAPEPAPAPVTELATIEIIGKTRARDLERGNLRTASDLMVACSDITSANNVAQSIGVALTTVLRWARAAELRRLPNLDVAHVNALVAGEFGSVESLAGVTASTVAAAMKDWWSSQAPIPSDETIQAWVVLATGTPSLVVKPPTV